MIGLLTRTHRHDRQRGFVAAFRSGLHEPGYVEGQNLAIEYRWADDNDRSPAVAADLVRRQVDVIVGSQHARGPCAPRQRRKPFRSFS